MSKKDVAGGLVITSSALFGFIFPKAARWILGGLAAFGLMNYFVKGRS